jgi:hypothetical protein
VIDSETMHPDSATLAIRDALHAKRDSHRRQWAFCVQKWSVLCTKLVRVVAPKQPQTHMSARRTPRVQA